MTGRMLAELARVAAADAHRALDPRHRDDDTDFPRPERVLTSNDWDDHRHLSEIAARCQVRAALAGWYPGDCPWQSDEVNEAIRCLVWDEVLGP